MPDTEGKSSDAAKQDDEPRYDAETWQEQAEATFGVSRHAVAGALAGERAKTFTERKVKEAVARFEKLTDARSGGDEQ